FDRLHPAVHPFRLDAGRALELAGEGLFFVRVLDLAERAQVAIEQPGAGHVDENLIVAALRDDAALDAGDEGGALRDVAYPCEHRLDARERAVPHPEPDPRVLRDDIRYIASVLDHVVHPDRG